MTKNGVSTTKQPGQFQYERFYSRILRKYRYAWDYRDLKGELHSGIAKTLKEAKAKAAAFGYED